MVFGFICVCLCVFCFFRHITIVPLIIPLSGIKITSLFLYPCYSITHWSSRLCFQVLCVSKWQPVLQVGASTCCKMLAISATLIRPPTNSTSHLHKRAFKQEIRSRKCEKAVFFAMYVFSFFTLLVQPAPPLSLPPWMKDTAIRPTQHGRAWHNMLSTGKAIHVGRSRHMPVGRKEENTGADSWSVALAYLTSATKLTYPRGLRPLKDTFSFTSSHLGQPLLYATTLRVMQLLLYAIKVQSCPNTFIHDTCTMLNCPFQWFAIVYIRVCAEILGAAQTRQHLYPLRESNLWQWLPTFTSILTSVKRKHVYQSFRHLSRLGLSVILD